MTWLQGTSTWGNIVDDIVKLACGEIADGAAVTCAIGDRWIREIAGQNLMRTPSSVDVNTGTLHQRAGYATLVSYKSTTLPTTYSWLQGVCQQTGIWSGVPTGVTNNRWVLAVRVDTANTTPGDYSTAVLRFCTVDGDTGSTITAGSSVAPNAAGNVTITSASKSATFNVTDPSGTLVVGTMWMRAFTSVYLGGIDSFGPMWHRRTGNATFTVNPPGTVTTDYVTDVDIAAPTAAQQLNPASVAIYAAGGSGSITILPGLWGGVGIKTNTSLTGAQYAFSWTMAYFKMRPLANSGASNGQIDLEWGGSIALDGATYRRMGGYKITAWLRPFSTPGSVSSSSALQYWMSVKPNKIIIVLNGDPGNSGLITDAGVWSFTPFDYLGGSYDKFPIFVSRPPINSTGSYIGGQMQMTYMHQVWRQDGSELRDWQDKWMRYDMCHITTITGMSAPSSTNERVGIFSSLTGTGNGPIYPIEGYNDTDLNTTGYGAGSNPLISTKPNAITGKWRMYGFPIADRVWWVQGSGGGSQGTDPIVPFEDDIPRGYVAGSVSSPFLYLPSGLWASGDELTDTVSGKKFFLVSHDTTGTGIFAGLLGAFNTGAGVAILEE